MGMRIDFGKRVAIRKLLPLPESCEMCGWEAVGPDAVIYSFAPYKFLKKGKNAGKKRYGAITHKAVVTLSEIRAEESSYELETGRCAICGGDGQEWAGWNHKDGHRFKICSRCEGSGKAIGDERGDR
jgi:hypothetical protein